MNESQSTTSSGHNGHSGGCFIYEVNLSINLDTFEKHGDWFMGHIEDMLKSNQFLKAEICKEINLNPIDDSPLRLVNLSIKYYLDDYEKLISYLEKQAKIMRSQVVEKFKNNYSISRRVFSIEKQLEN